MNTFLNLSIIFVFAYNFGLILVFFALFFKKYHTKPIKNANFTKYGVTFNSTFKHKIRAENVKFIEIQNAVYLKQNNKTIVIKNIEQPFTKGNYFYFKGKGEVKIIFNAKNFYKYFNIQITSPTFDLSAIKQKAVNDILNNLFNLNNCSQLKYYLKIVTQILNITITDNKVEVKKNKYNLNFQLTYKVNNTIKKINIG